MENLEYNQPTVIRVNDPYSDVCDKISLVFNALCERFNDVFASQTINFYEEIELSKTLRIDRCPSFLFWFRGEELVPRVVGNKKEDLVNRYHEFLAAVDKIRDAEGQNEYEAELAQTHCEVTLED